MLSLSSFRILVSFCFMFWFILFFENSCKFHLNSLLGILFNSLFLKSIGMKEIVLQASGCLFYVSCVSMFGNVHTSITRVQVGFFVNYLYYFSESISGVKVKLCSNRIEDSSPPNKLVL